MVGKAQPAAMVMAAAVAAACAPAMADGMTIEQIRTRRIMMQAILANDVEGVRKTLNDDADPNLPIGDFTPLEAAVMQGNLELVKLLVERGADPATRKKDGTPLHQWATALGVGKVEAPGTQIGAYLKGRIAGIANPDLPRRSDKDIAADKLDDGIVIMPEAALNAQLVEKADLSTYNNVPVPAGWKTYRAEKEKAWILSNGKDDARGIRIIVADPMEIPDSLNLIRKHLEQAVQGYAEVCGIPTGETFEITTTITTYRDGELSVSADVMGMEKHDVVATFDLDGRIRDGKMYTVLLHRGKDEETAKAISLYMDFYRKALRGD